MLELMNGRKCSPVCIEVMVNGREAPSWSVMSCELETVSRVRDLTKGSTAVGSLAAMRSEK